MKAVKHTGLVPVKSAKTGAVFGVPPSAAAAGVAKNELTLVPIPDGIETIAVGGEPPASDAKVEGTVKPGHPEIPENWEDMHHLQQIKLALKLQPGFQPEGEESKSEAAKRVIREALAGDGSEGSEVIEIPADWEALHYNARIALAKSISGGNIELTDEQKAADTKVSDLADGIIRAEIEQRAAASTAQDDPAA